MTEEHKKAISKSMMGHKVSSETRNRLSVANKGKKKPPLTEEQKQRLRKLNVGRKRSEEVKRRISKKHMGMKHTEETKRKMSMAKKGCLPWNKGLTGENSSSWKGGISNYPYPYEWQNTLKESIRQRDDYVCQLCGIHQEELKGRFKKLDIHHIDYNKDNLNVSNLISLCRKCHMETNHNREYWSNYFIFEGGGKD